MMRPDEGRVANNGTFVLNDHKRASALSGAFCAFDANGRKIIRRDFKANIFNSDLSRNGRFAACQTCNSPDANDSSILAIFDLIAAKEIASWTPLSGWPQFYEFFEDEERIGLGYRGLGVFRYSLQGDFVDRSAWYAACLTKGDYATTLLVAQRIMEDERGSISPELYSMLVACIDRVLPELSKADNGWHALAWRLRGMCLEASGALEAALSCYEKALKLNPKVGIKRRAAQLGKALARGSSS
ncbi:MAG: tetratricopeptide repeat protein [Beijerinckiaceae bacterium]